MGPASAAYTVDIVKDSDAAFIGTKFLRKLRNKVQDAIDHNWSKVEGPAAVAHVPSVLRKTCLEAGPERPASRRRATVMLAWEPSCRNFLSLRFDPLIDRPSVYCLP